MKVNRCLASVCEEANEEFFIRVPEANIGMSESARSICCWIPDAAKKELRKFTVVHGMRNLKKVFLPSGHVLGRPPEPEAPPVFIILGTSEGDTVFVIKDLIVFAGGDVLAMLAPSEYTGLNLADPHQIMPH